MLKLIYYSYLTEVLVHAKVQTQKVVLMAVAGDSVTELIMQF